jgi:thiol-disulfide isomerase/thioredoxin
LKKIIVLLVIGFLVIFIMTGCDSIIPGEGEGEPESDKVVVLVEAYVASGCLHCQKVEPILEQLAGEYNRDEMILVEVIPWGDYYDIPEAYQRYQWYGLTGGVPQITFNGLNGNIFGESTYSTIKNRIESQLSAEPTIELQAFRTTDSTGTVISGKVKNISSTDLNNLVVNGMTFKDMGTMGFHYAVTDIFEKEKVNISLLTPGQEVNFTITIEGLNWDGLNLDGVIFVQSVNHPKKVIRQSVFID